MSTYDDLKVKWRGLSKSRKETTCFNDVKLAPQKFCVHIHDEGHSGPCGSCIETTGFFDDAHDALAYYRFAEIPRLLEWLSGVERGEFPDEAEVYLTDFPDGERDGIERLLRLIDEALRSPSVENDVLGEIQALHNALFSETNPMNQILAWGSIGHILTSPFFTEAFHEHLSMEDDTKDSPTRRLKDIVDKGIIDEKNDEHLSLAAEFLEVCASF